MVLWKHYVIRKLGIKIKNITITHIFFWNNFELFYWVASAIIIYWLPAIVLRFQFSLSPSLRCSMFVTDHGIESHFVYALVTLVCSNIMRYSWFMSYSRLGIFYTFEKLSRSSYTLYGIITGLSCIVALRFWGSCISFLCE